MKVCVIGLGKIGLPLVAQYSSMGLEVIGCDINEEVVNMLNKGESFVKEEPGLEEKIKTGFGRGLIKASTNTVSAVKESEVAVVIVPLIIDDKKNPDFRALDSVTKQIGEGLEKGKGTLVVYETTLPVGTTRNRFLPVLEKSGLREGKDFYLAFSPERVNSGDVFLDLERYPKIVGGVSEESGKKAEAFYKKALAANVINVGCSRAAEMVKLCGMTYRDYNIALANNFAQFAEKSGIDVSKVIGAANTIPHTHILSPGIGVGGHCAPVYPHFLVVNEKEKGVDSALIEAARNTNDSMPGFAVGILKERMGSLKGKRVLLLGIAYRENVRETAFAPSLAIIAALKKEKAEVYASDPLFSDKEIESYGVKAAAFDSPPEIDAAIMASMHTLFNDLDVGLLAKAGAKFFLDGRNAVAKKEVERAGMEYIAIGMGE